MAMAGRLTNLRIKNIAAVGSPANRRTWLIVKSAISASKANLKSENERRRILEQAVQRKWGRTNDWGYACLADIYDGDAILQIEGVPYVTEFSIDADGEVSFGELRRVTLEWVEKRQHEEFAKKAWSTAVINALPDSSFAIISAGGDKDDDGKTTPRSLRHLPYKNADGSVDLSHLRNALARLDQIDASDADKAKARKKLDAAASEAGIGKKGDAMTFDDAMMGRKLHKVYMALSEQYGALMETIQSIRESDDGNKGSAIKAAITDFLNSMKTSIPRVLSGFDEDDDDLEKAGKKISATRMAKLRMLHKTLGEIIAEGEAEMAEKKMDASVLTKLGSGIAALFGRAAGADDAIVAEFEKAAHGQTPEPVPAAVEALLAKSAAEAADLKKSNDELKARLDKAEAATTAAAEEAKKLRDEQDLRKFADEVAGWKDIGLDPAKDAALLKSIEDKVGKESADRVREIFRAQLAQKNASGLMREIGSSAAPLAADSAAAEIEQKIGALLQKNDKLDRSAAMNQVFSENPALYDRYRTEVLVKV